MKPIIAILLASITIAAQCQTSTNDFRIVDGKLYNIQRSTNWVQLVPASGVTMTLVRKTPEGDWGFSYEISAIGFVSYGIIKNLPGVHSEREEIKVCRAMRVGRKEKSGEEIMLYDYGTPNVKGKP